MIEGESLEAQFSTDRHPKNFPIPSLPISIYQLNVDVDSIPTQFISDNGVVAPLLERKL